MHPDTTDAVVHDPQIPAVAGLLSSAAAEILTRALVPLGGRIDAARLSQLDFYPGHATYAVYDATVRWTNRASREQVVAMVRHDNDVKGSCVEVAGSPVGVWLYPDDPFLPGMAPAADPGFVSDLLADLGIRAGETDLYPRSYGPRSRAVVEVRSLPFGRKLVFRPGHGISEPDPETVLYLKAVRPSRVERLRDLQGLVSRRLAVAPLLASYDDLGLLALAPLDGEPLWNCVKYGTFAPPTADELLAVLDAIADLDGVPRSPRAGLLETTRDNARTMALVFPRLAGRLEAFVEALGPDVEQPEITVHGDFHEMQTLVGPDGVTGVLDLDDVGRGYRVDDLAMLLGRLWTFARREPSSRAAATAYRGQLQARFEEEVDPYELRRRMAATAFNHADIAFRFQAADWRMHTQQALVAAMDWLFEVLPDLAPER